MTEEIKEILEYLKNDNVELPFGMATIDEKRLLNYITNLQKENEKLKDELKYTIPQVEHNQIVSKLCREKQDYKQKNENLQNENEQLRAELNTLKMSEEQWLDKTLGGDE